ncbi:hypothetical protein IFM89_013421 [Coptis chinensis]|uniref:Uncharacterized protein n=1 Tax=Coptis chinensis TaxID=261450 RepID=A0A835GWA1_9MAGN|nr:hypothetical protein IFM89_013421 [Coptis chinensis]
MSGANNIKRYVEGDRYANVGDSTLGFDSEDPPGHLLGLSGDISFDIGRRGLVLGLGVSCQVRVSDDGSNFKCKYKFKPYFYAATKMILLFLLNFLKADFKICLGLASSSYSKVSNVVYRCINTFTDFTRGILGTYMEDDDTVLRSKTPMVEYASVNVSSITFSLDQIREVKSKIGAMLDQRLWGAINLVSTHLPSRITSNIKVQVNKILVVLAYLEHP